MVQSIPRVENILVILYPTRRNKEFGSGILHVHVISRWQREGDYRSHWSRQKRRGLGFLARFGTINFLFGPHENTALSSKFDGHIFKFPGVRRTHSSMAFHALLVSLSSCFYTNSISLMLYIDMFPLSRGTKNGKLVVHVWLHSNLKCLYDCVYNSLDLICLSQVYFASFTEGWQAIFDNKRHLIQHSGIIWWCLDTWMTQRCPVGSPRGSRDQTKNIRCKVFFHFYEWMLKFKTHLPHTTPTTRRLRDVFFFLCL